MTHTTHMTPPDGSAALLHRSATKILGVILACTATGVGADADTLVFSGPLAETRLAFEAAAGCDLGIETFDSFAPGAVIEAMPGVNAVMTPEDASGAIIGLPVVIGGTPITPPLWTVNFGNGRPAWSPWVIRPIAGESIHAFGQVNAQGDWVLIEGFDADGSLVASVEAPPIVEGAFAGFVTDVPVARVVVTPLGNFDGLNGLDDLAVSTTPPEPCRADYNGDGVVDGADLGLLLGAWGTAATDLNCDGVTDGADLGLVLASWGPCGRRPQPE